MNQQTLTTIMASGPSRTSGFPRRMPDVTGYDLLMICTQQDGQKVRSIVPAETPIREVDAFFRHIGSLNLISN